MKMLILIRRAKFSTSASIQTDKGTNKKNIFEERKDLRDEKDVLKSDLDSIADAVRAASKYEELKQPLIHETKKLEDLMENYAAFFDSESEDDESLSLPNKIMKLKSYLKSELTSNQAESKRLVLLNRSGPSSLVGKKRPIESDSPEDKSIGESKKRPIDITDDESTNKGKERAPEFGYYDTKGKGKEKVVDHNTDGSTSKGKEKASIETGESSSKKEIQSYNDFIDSIYSEYNPFDDVGTD